MQFVFEIFLLIINRCYEDIKKYDTVIDENVRDHDALSEEIELLPSFMNIFEMIRTNRILFNFHSRSSLHDRKLRRPLVL